MTAPLYCMPTMPPTNWLPFVDVWEMTPETEQPSTTAPVKTFDSPLPLR